MPTMPVVPSTRRYSWSDVYLVVMSGASGWLAEITVGNEGRLDDPGGLGTVAHRNLDGSAGRRKTGRNEAQRDGLAQRGRKAAAGDDADGMAVRVEDFGAIPGRRALDDQADASAREFPLTLGENPAGA